MYSARRAPELPKANQRRIIERKEAERRRGELLDQAMDMMTPYVFGELAGQPIPDSVKTRYLALEKAAKAIEIPPYL